jgi:hypothetical protein
MCNIKKVCSAPSTEEVIYPIAYASSSYTKELEKVTRKVKEIALFALKVLACAFLFWLNPLLLIGAFFVGSKWFAETKAYVADIERIWSEQAWYLKAVFAAIGALALPYTIGAISVLFAADIGATLFSRNASAGEKQQMPPVILTV